MLQTEFVGSSVATSRTLACTNPITTGAACSAMSYHTKVRVRAYRPRSGLPAVYVVTLPPPGLEGRGLSVSLGEKVSLPDWKRGVSLPDWKAGVSLPAFKRGVSLSDWKAGVSLPDWKAGVSLTDWKAGVSLPDWKEGVSLPDWKAGVSLPDWRAGVSLPD